MAFKARYVDLIIFYKFKSKCHLRAVLYRILWGSIGGKKQKSLDFSRLFKGLIGGDGGN